VPPSSTFSRPLPSCGLLMRSLECRSTAVRTFPTGTGRRRARPRRVRSQTCASRIAAAGMDLSSNTSRCRVLSTGLNVFVITVVCPDAGAGSATVMVAKLAKSAATSSDAPLNRLAISVPCLRSRPPTPNRLGAEHPEQGLAPRGTDVHSQRSGPLRGRVPLAPRSRQVSRLAQRASKSRLSTRSAPLVDGAPATGSLMT
jgi:hypothetical protein